jgi:hypothetical protein
MMAAVARARHNLLQDCLNSKHFAIGSINSPMQCMLKISAGNACSFIVILLRRRRQLCFPASIKINFCIA